MRKSDKCQAQVRTLVPWAVGVVTGAASLEADPAPLTQLNTGIVQDPVVLLPGVCCREVVTWTHV